ncbi:hypothetical protein LOK49_LG13G02850 [Camellia lanceoleosa]|uniref:Uncharacterized protein n=1 Tax=Camellia lanceoleosa TaxID=1840588 RepID=A0ACC0FGX7_9ERIC|nr:hypothetical protein LOK49_LG13G02850 [Camellia lanceoleosa]
MEICAQGSSRLRKGQSAPILDGVQRILKPAKLDFQVERSEAMRTNEFVLAKMAAQQLDEQLKQAAQLSTGLHVVGAVFPSAVAAAMNSTGGAFGPIYPMIALEPIIFPLGENLIAMYVFVFGAERAKLYKLGPACACLRI